MWDSRGRSWKRSWRLRRSGDRQGPARLDDQNLVVRDLAARRKRSHCRRDRAREDQGAGFSGKADWSMIKAVKDAVSIRSSERRCAVGPGREAHARGDRLRRRDDRQGHRGESLDLPGGEAVSRDRDRPSAPALDERQAVMLRHLKDMVRLAGATSAYGDAQAPLLVHEGAARRRRVRERVNHLTGVNDVKQEIEEYFASLRAPVPAAQQ